MASSTSIRILLNPQPFVSGFKNFPVHTKRVQIELACPHASDDIRIHSGAQGSSAIKFVQSMRYKAPDSGGKYVLFLLLCRHVGLLFGKRLGTDLLRHRIKKNPDSPVHVTRFVEFFFFLLWRADLKMSGFAVELAECMWREAVSGKKKFKNIRILRPGPNAVLHMSRTQFNQLGSCEVRRLTQLSSTDFIWSD